ncbi:MAG: cytochrome P450 [Brasilonema octagenarum HA4186-MV1]|jgi:cytochrome P450|uniref:Cytochrome P450 n=2 Tax=Brasilonema TaxID=383614 RepID=A0A856MEJ4_9CYAN|nr:MULTISPECIES: cytochrome P450 [Brasilonema]MBW4628884.1 cytochrome P450 [Brasilonema octagenarum HA4186-MV1]NMF65695.1 cytochrome P450 [Brasilonema octagenarum UFV-OR1]QDL07376.1 cytochrome P450 [Brasilonema sennae CENA114]QDL13738.1 cytochrome P450 [Brasilonema octagenarum UFV-E1]
MKLPNCPRTPWFVQVYQWGTHPTHFLDSCTQRYGDIFMVRWPASAPIVFVSNPKAIEQIYTAPKELFNIAETYEILRPLVGDQSLMVLDGKLHERQRSLVMPSLHGGSLRSYGKLICKLTEQMMQQWKLGEVINLSSWADNISMNVMFQVVFGLDEGEHLVKLRQKISSILDYFSSPIIVLHLLTRSLQKDLGAWSPWGRFVRLLNEVDQLLYAEIAQRRQQPQPDRTDVLSLLMSARDEQGEAMSDRELRDEVMTVLSGKGVAATAIIFGLYCLQKHPEVYQRLQSELDSISNPLDTNAIAKLPYLTAISQETLRLYSLSVVAMRVATTSFELMGYKFSAGTHVYANIHSLHHRQDLFPNPEQFKPERFLERQFTSHEYSPFGGGHRRCIGYAFAPFQMKLVLATIVSRYQLKLVDDRPFNLVRHAAGVAPNKDIKMIVTGFHDQKPKPKSTSLLTPINAV